MSLFKLRQLWTRSFPEEEFDEKHLSIGKLGKQACLILGSFSGFLRVFLIQKNNHLQVQCIYENKFDSPIIDVKFVPHPEQQNKFSTIGVLFFRKFSYINFELKNNTYETKILNIDVDPSFGIGVSPLSVMTLNSSVQYLNPFQTQKIKVGDPIYPFSRSMNKLYFVDGEQLVQIEGSTEQWRIIVGRIRQLFVFGDTVIVIGERALWEINHAKIVKTKVMEEQISCGAIALRGGSSFNIVVANFANQMLIYSSNYSLLWAVKLDSPVLKIIVCQNQDIKGAICLLTEQGNLSISYAGSEMPDTVIQILSEKIDIHVVEEETSRFIQLAKQKKQNNTQARAYSSPQKNSYCDFKVTFLQEKSFENHSKKNKLFKVDGKIMKGQLIIDVLTKQAISNVKIQLALPSNLYCDDLSKTITLVRAKQKVIFMIYTNNQNFPYEIQVKVSIRFENAEKKNSAPEIKIFCIGIPMKMQCQISGFESKEAKDNGSHKIIIKSNTELPSFNQIFPEMFVNQENEQRKTIQFTLSNGVKCEITYNKSFNKAKIESQFYSGLCYIIAQFSNHLRTYNKKNNTKIELSVEIPLEEFFSVMKEHYGRRNALRKAYRDVDIKSQEFRNTEKKLLIKLKQKMSSVNGIDKLLEYTYQKLNQSISAYEAQCQQIQIINHNLAIAITLIIQLLFIRSNPSQQAKKIALGIIGYQKENLDFGWEQKLMANSAYYLNKKYKKGDSFTFEQLQKIPLYVISKVNNGDWNQ